MSENIILYCWKNPFLLVKRVTRFYDYLKVKISLCLPWPAENVKNLVQNLDFRWQTNRDSHPSAKTISATYVPFLELNRSRTGRATGLPSIHSQTVDERGKGLSQELTSNGIFEVDVGKISRPP